MEKIKIGGRYKHFKGNEYMVVYQAQYNSPEFGENAVWVRPSSMFLDEKEADGKMVKRFELVG